MLLARHQGTQEQSNDDYNLQNWDMALQKLRSTDPLLLSMILRPQSCEQCKVCVCVCVYVCESCDGCVHAAHWH